MPTPAESAPSRPRWSIAVGVTAAVTASLIFVAWAKMETVQITYRIADLEAEDQDLAVEQRRLRSQLSELRSPRRLEALAPKLGLVEPESGQVVVVADDVDDPEPEEPPPPVISDEDAP